MTHKWWIINMNDEMMTSYLVPLTLEWINSNSWGRNNHWTCTNNNSSNTTVTITSFIKLQQTNSNKPINSYLNSNNENKESISCRADVEPDQFLQFIRFNHVQVKTLSGNNESIIIDVIVLCSSKNYFFIFIISQRLNQNVTNVTRDIIFCHMTSRGVKKCQ